MQLGHILLTSSGFSNSTLLDLVQSLVDKNGYKTACVITTAHPKKEKSVWATHTYSQLADLGVTVTFVDFEKGENGSGADILYVCGGNTCTLAHYAREAGFIDVVNDCMQRGGMYIGSSAGSVLLSPTIASAAEIHPDKNATGLQDLLGLDVIDFHIIPHYRDTDAQIVANFKKRHIEPTEILRDGEAIHIHGDSIQRLD